MPLSHMKRLCTLLPTLIAASLQESTTVSPTSSSLPVPLQRAVPACALPCLRTSLSDQFPVACTSPVDFNCLCAHYSIDGEALGEVALGCIYASCPTNAVGSSAAGAAYNVCLGQKGAVIPTETALTVAVSASSSTPSNPTTTSAITKGGTPSTSAPTSASTSLSSIPSSSEVSTSSATSSPSPAGNTAVAQSASLPTSTSSTQPAQSVSAAATAGEGPRTMKPAQIAGLSVAAAATLILAIGLMVLSVCLRRRRERKQIAEIMVDEKKPQSPRSRKYSSRISKRFSSKNRSPTRTQMKFPLPPGPFRYGRGVGITPVARKNSNTDRTRRTPVSPFMPANGAAFGPTASSSNAVDIQSIHPAHRPRMERSQPYAPNDQIGLAISAELPGDSVPVIRAPKPPQGVQAKQQRPKSVIRRSGIGMQRPDSVLTEATEFEEDEQRRSSVLLPAPPVPIPPIRALQPSRPAQGPGWPSRQEKSGPGQQQLLNQPELFLDIPIRHSKFQPKRVPTPEAQSRAPAAPYDRTRRRSSAYDQYKGGPTTVYTPEQNYAEYIPDYYFNNNVGSSKQGKRVVSPGRVVRAKGSPKLVNVTPKASSSTVSRATSWRSRGSSNPRDSVASQTSFETADPNDPTPEDDDDEKQISDDSRLSPVAESPISRLRYPKVPRASNQLVPRSPCSPQSLSSDRSVRVRAEPSSLLAKRLGTREARDLEQRLQMGSPVKADIKRQHQRSVSSDVHWSQPWTADSSHRRSHSGQWPKSPVMYDADYVHPLNVRPKQSQHYGQAPVEMEALKSPAWVPRLTPTRQGDDLLISVSYSKPGR